jgi:hypothetical protein
MINRPFALIQAYNIETFDKYMNDAFQNGYFPHGNMCAVSSGEKIIYVQLFILKELKDGK